MTITMSVEKREGIEVTLEWEKPGVIYARVYEKWGNEWHQINESRPYPVSMENNARATYRRYLKKYIVD